MASKTCSSSLALFLTLNLLFFALVSACGSCPGPNPRPRPRPRPRPSPNPSGGSSPGSGSSPGGGSSPGCPSPSGCGPTPSGGNPPSGGTNPAGPSCPRDALQLGVCANVLNGLLNVTLGQPPVTPCCSLLSGLVDLEAAVCLCTALRANILGINLNLPISLSLLLNVCSRNVPRNFQCA